MKCYEAIIDIYSGTAGKVCEFAADFPSGHAPVVEDLGSAIRVVCEAENKAAATAVAAAEHKKYSTTPISMLDKQYHRKPLQRGDA